MTGTLWSVIEASFRLYLMNFFFFFLYNVPRFLEQFVETLLVRKPSRFSVDFFGGKIAQA